MRSTHLALAASFSLFLSLVACSDADVDGGADDRAVESPPSPSQTASALTASSSSGCDADAVAGSGWVSTSIPSSSNAFGVTFRATPEVDASARPPLVDAVIGLSSGAADDFGDLGPAIRFNTNGTIDVRNGATYAADIAFPYAPGRGPYEFRVDVDVPSHTYSVWVRHLDAVEKPLEKLASHYAFRVEQQSVTSLDTLARYVDGPTGGVQTCDVTYTPMQSSAPLLHAYRARMNTTRFMLPW